MDQDYLLIAVDPEKKVAIRFLCLRHGAGQSLSTKCLPSDVISPYLELLVGSVLLGSRSNDQESILYKFHCQPSGLRINCEVNPLGAFRSALFPPESLESYEPPLKGMLHVTILSRKNQVYTSSLEISKSGVVQTLRDYLRQSIQVPSILSVCVHEKPQEGQYGLWIERLPGTSDQDWHQITERFQTDEKFFSSIRDTKDPDRILENLFPFPLRILAVTKPKLTCACNLEAFERAIASLPKEDLLELFMEGEGVESVCDYCGKIWKVKNQFISELLQTTPEPQ